MAGCGRSVIWPFVLPRTITAFLFFVSCWLLARPAWASTRNADSPLVVLTEEGRKDAEDAAFFSSVRTFAAEIGIAVSKEDVPSLLSVRDALLAETRGQRKPFLVAWILREGQARTIHLFDPWNNQLRTRTIEASASVSASAEAMALILRAELVAYLQEPPSPSLPTSPAPPAPPPPPVSETRMALLGAYSVETFLRGQGLQDGVRVGGEIAWHGILVGLSCRLSSASELNSQGAAVTVRRHPLMLNLGYVSHEYRRLRWGGDVFVVGDWISRHTSTALSPLAPTIDSGNYMVSVGGRGLQELRLFRHLALLVTLGADVPLNPLQFQVLRGTTTQTVGSVCRVCVAAEVGLGVPLF
jgi:hypothetical protein